MQVFQLIKNLVLVVGSPVPANTRPVVAEGANAYTLDSSSLPAGLQWNSVDGTISGTPSGLFQKTTLKITIDDTVQLVSQNGYFDLEVQAGAPTITWHSITYAKNYGDSPFPLLPPTSTSSGVFTYSSSDPSVATVDAASRQVTIVGAGEATITVTQAASGNYMAGSATVTVTVIVAPIAPTITCTTTTYTKSTNSAKFSVNRPANLSSSNTTVAFDFDSNAQTVATVDPSGEVTIQQAGVAIITAKQAASRNYTSGSLAIKVTVVPLLTAVVDRPILTGKIGEGFSKSTPVSSHDGEPPYTYSIAPLLPAGLILDSTTGAITGTPSGSNAQPNRKVSYTVTVQDVTGKAALGVFLLMIGRPPEAEGLDEGWADLASWDEYNHVRFRNKGETAAIDTGWSLNGIVAKTTTTGFNLVNTNTAVNIGLTVNALVNMPIVINLMTRATTVSGYVKSYTQTGRNEGVTVNRKFERITSRYLGDFRVTWIDPPPLDVNIVFAAPAGAVVGHDSLAREETDKFEGKHWDNGKWIALTEDDLKKASVWEDFNKIDNSDARLTLLNLKDYVDEFNKQIPGLNRTHMPSMGEGVDLKAAAAQNARLTLNMTLGGAQTFHYYSAWLRSFYVGSATAYYFGSMRSYYWKDRATTVEYDHFLGLSTCVYHFKCLGEKPIHGAEMEKWKCHDVQRALAPSKVSYRYEGTMEMETVTALDGVPGAVPEIKETLMQFRMAYDKNKPDVVQMQFMAPFFKFKSAAKKGSQFEFCMGSSVGNPQRINDGGIQLLADGDLQIHIQRTIVAEAEGFIALKTKEKITIESERTEINGKFFVRGGIYNFQ